MKIDKVDLNGGTLGPIVCQKASNISSPESGQLSISNDLALQIFDNKWETVADATGDLFAFTTHTFTGAGSNALQAPTVTQCASAYAGKPFIGDLSLFNCIEGVQIWTVPRTGRYRIRSQGGSNRALGGGVQIEALLTKGDKLRMIVGRNYAWSACGASVVYSDAKGLLSIAGGAGATIWATHWPVPITTLSVSGSPSSGGSSQGIADSKSPYQTAGTGGGGWSGNGDVAQASGHAVGGLGGGCLNPILAFPGTGGTGMGSQSDLGCFGGGGGSGKGSLYTMHGGGGGYEGGSSRTSSSSPYGGSNGSNFAEASLPVRQYFQPAQNQDGYIQITGI